MNPKFFRNGLVMLVLVVGTAALLFTWIQSTTADAPADRLLAFLTDVKDGKVAKVVQQGETLTVKAPQARRLYTVTVPSILTQVLQRHASPRPRPATSSSARLDSRRNRHPTRRGSVCC